MADNTSKTPLKAAMAVGATALSDLDKVCKEFALSSSCAANGSAQYSLSDMRYRFSLEYLGQPYLFQCKIVNTTGMVRPLPAFTVHRNSLRTYASLPDAWRCLATVLKNNLDTVATGSATNVTDKRPGIHIICCYLGAKAVADEDGVDIATRVIGPFTYITKYIQNPLRWLDLPRGQRSNRRKVYAQWIVDMTDGTGRDDPY